MLTRHEVFSVFPVVFFSTIKRNLSEKPYSMIFSLANLNHLFGSFICLLFPWWRTSISSYLLLGISFQEMQKCHKILTWVLWHMCVQLGFVVCFGYVLGQARPSLSSSGITGIYQKNSSVLTSRLPNGTLVYSIWILFAYGYSWV